MDLFNPTKIRTLADEPAEAGPFDTWIQQQDVIPFLQHEINDEHIIIYTSLPHVFIHAVLIPNVELGPSTVDDLLRWNHNPYSSWSLVLSAGDVWIEGPLSGSDSEILKDGEQIVFARSFEGYLSRRSYIELNQKISHILELHHVPERDAWCRLDQFGDLEDIVKVTNLSDLPRNEPGRIVTIKRDILGQYASVEDLVLLRMYDFTRFRTGSFSGWGADNKSHDFGDGVSIYGRLVVVPSVGSYSRGVQVADIRVPKKQVIDNTWGRGISKEDKKYATFIALDWKNGRVAEISCDPACLANYFTESDLPFEITPVFFRPEVLLKYKSDKAKYKLNDRSISCRGAWHLETFDINGAGQVHTYLIYLSRLPYEEQLHWKQFNEAPKTGVSERVFATDFKGQFYDKYDPLSSLKHKLRDLHCTKPGWWTLRDEDAPQKVHYPYTDSRDEWADEILNLDQLLVEGFEEKWLRRKAKELGRVPDDRLRALRLVEECLIAVGFEKDHAHQIMSPFHVVHNLRSILKGHTLGMDAENARQEALKQFGSFRSHFEQVCADCDESMRIIIEAFKGF